MRFYGYIKEGKLTKKEKKTLNSVLLSQKPGTYDISGEEVKVEKKGQSLIFSFDKEAIDLTASIIDLADALEMNVKHKESGSDVILTIS